MATWGGAANASTASGSTRGLATRRSASTIRNTGPRCGRAPITPVSNAIEDIPLAKAYAVLAEMTPLITDAQAKAPSAPRGSTRCNRGGTLRWGITSSTSTFSATAESGAGAGLCHRRLSGPRRVLCGGPRCASPLHAQHAGTGNCRLARVETGKFVDGKWIPGRKVNGDDVVLNYDQAAAAAQNQSGSGLIFGGDGPAIQHVKLYRYR